MLTQSAPANSAFIFKLFDFKSNFTLNTSLTSYYLRKLFAEDRVQIDTLTQIYISETFSINILEKLRLALNCITLGFGVLILSLSTLAGRVSLPPQLCSSSQMKPGFS